MNVLKVIEVLASSEKSWEDAARNAVTSASKTLKGIRSVYIKDQSAVVNENNITEFRITCKVTFEVYES
ncbi:MAG: dodecin family protein [Methylococcaceae bacterium]|nr:dodecin family protein [Prolixibacteraceae bacterium]